MSIPPQPGPTGLAVVPSTTPSPLAGPPEPTEAPGDEELADALAPFPRSERLALIGVAIKVRAIEQGAVALVVHQGKLVQIETKAMYDLE